MLRASTRNKLAGVGLKPRFLQGSVDEVSFLGERAFPRQGSQTVRQPCRRAQGCEGHVLLCVLGDDGELMCEKESTRGVAVRLAGRTIAH